MPEEYRAMKRRFKAEGLSDEEAKSKAARIYNARRRPGQRPVTRSHKSNPGGRTKVVASKSKRPLSAIAAGIKRRGTEGALTAEGKRHGYSSAAAYCRAVRNKPGTSTRTKRRCALAATFAKHRPTGFGKGRWKSAA